MVSFTDYPICFVTSSGDLSLLKPCSHGSLHLLKIFLTPMQIFHVPQTAERARMLLQQLSKFKLFPVTEATLKMVCHDTQRGFYTSSIRMQKPHITDLKLHYGEGFSDIHKELLETLQQRDSTGITFLHGPSGTGKTYYIRYLMNEIKDKSLIYVPPDLVNVSQLKYIFFSLKNYFISLLPRRTIILSFFYKLSLFLLYSVL